jgi:SAM-dependent methyltransferase
MPLAYYSRAATEAFWAEHWAGHDTSALVDVARTSPLTAIVEAALPASGRILEAGCGLGQYVVLMRERGRSAIGADWSLDALRRCRATAPGTPLAAMDLARLAIATASVDAYVSLGVVEHDPDGPDRLLAEAARVLAPRGRLIVSVPYWNGVRRLGTFHLRRAGRRVRASGGQFYQFAFSRPEVRAALAAHGFRVLSFHPYDPTRMVRPLLRRIAGRGAAGDTPGAPPTPGRRVPVLRRLAYSGVALRLCAHMLLAVAERR